MGAENSHRYNSGCIENFLRNMSTHISSQELPFPLKGFGVFMCILSYVAKMFDHCVRALVHHLLCTPFLCASMRRTNNSVFRWEPGKSIFRTSTWSVSYSMVGISFLKMRCIAM